MSRGQSQENFAGQGLCPLQRNFSLHHYSFSVPLLTARFLIIGRSPGRDHWRASQKVYGTGQQGGLQMHLQLAVFGPRILFAPAPSQVSEFGYLLERWRCFGRAGREHHLQALRQREELLSGLLGEPCLHEGPIHLASTECLALGGQSALTRPHACTVQFSRRPGRVAACPAEQTSLCNC